MSHEKKVLDKVVSQGAQPPRIICVPVQLARFEESVTFEKEFCLGTRFCNIECVGTPTVARRSVIFNCDSVRFCIDFNVCLQFFPCDGGSPFCQTFQVCVSKDAEFDCELIQKTDLVCVLATDPSCSVTINNNNNNNACETEFCVELTSGIHVRLFQNSVLFGVPNNGIDFGVKPIPKKLSCCGFESCDDNCNGK